MVLGGDRRGGKGERVVSRARGGRELGREVGREGGIEVGIQDGKVSLGDDTLA